MVIGVEVVNEDGTEPRVLAADAPAKLDTKEREESTAEELEALSTDMIGIDDSVRMYLREVGTVALLTAEEEVVLAKAIELGAQLVEAPRNVFGAAWSRRVLGRTSSGPLCL